MLPHKADANENLVVFAASSLTDTLTELGQSFERAEGINVTLSLASSSVLARQIKDGAPAHLFISANSAWMDDVVDAGAIKPDSLEVIAGNRLVLAGAKDNSLPPVNGPYLTSEYPLENLMPNLRFAIGNPDHVPAGMYARQALENLGLWKDIQDRLIPMPNVRAVMANIDRGEVAGGFVYASDLRFSRNAQLIALFPETAHAPIRYLAGIVRQETDSGADTAIGIKAERFLSFLVSQEAKVVFTKFGFLPPP